MVTTTSRTVFAGYVCNVFGVNAAFALDKRDNSFLWRRLMMRAILGFAADVGFQRPYGLVSAAEAAFVAVRGIAHCFTNAMRERNHAIVIRAESEIAHEPMRAMPFLLDAMRWIAESLPQERNIATLPSQCQCGR